MAYACLEVCLSSFDKTLGSPLQGELVIRFCFRGSVVFCIEKPRGLVTTVLSSELDVCHPYGLI
jgi:hypothetical protein